MPTFIATAVLRPVKSYGQATVRQPDRTRAERILLVSVMLLALLLRLRGLSSFSFEQDELYTMFEGRDLFGTQLQPGIAGRPLYFLLQHVLLEVMPQTPFGLRIVPLVFGMTGVWLTALIAKRVFGGSAGIIAATFVAISPWHIQASTFARYWSLVYLLAAAFFLLLWTAYQSERKRDYFAALVVLIAGSATHPSFVFAAFGAALGVSLLTSTGRMGVRWPSSHAWRTLWGPYALFLLLAWLALRITGNGGALQNWHGRGWLASLRLIPAVVEWMTPVVFVAGGLGGLVAMASKQPSVRSWGVLALTGFSASMLLLLMASTRTDIYADYALAALPLVLVSAAGLLQSAVNRMRSRQVVALVCATLVVCAAIAPSTASHLSDGTRFDYRPAFEHVRRVAPKVTMLTWPPVLAVHYAPDLASRGLRMNEAALDSILAAETDLWVVASVRRYGLVFDDAGTITRWLGRSCSLEFTHEKPRWDYRQYRVELHRCRADLR
jgi:hypothetical protein